jgi:hypothetical protein
MFRRTPVSLALVLLFALGAPASFLSAPPCPEPNHDKTTWNYDGGLQMMTDGSVPSGPCFRLTGRASAPNYFENLKREDSDVGTFIHRGHDIVTEFPGRLHLSFLMYDLPCGYEFKPAGTRAYLTRALVGSMRVTFYWKHGLQMRPAPGIVLSHVETRRIPPYASEYADQLPEKLEWEFEFEVPSAGVPVTDSLVIVMLMPDGHIAARAAARM